MDTVSSDCNCFYVDISAYINKLGVMQECAVDKVHPNDLGFFCMAKALEQMLQKVLLSKK